MKAASTSVTRSSEGLNERCFASFLVETRAAASVDSTLKDFVQGDFERCQSTLQTTPSDANGDALPTITLGQDIYDKAVITGGGSNLFPTGNVTFFICAPTELTSGVCDEGDGNQVGSAVALTAIDPSTPPKSFAISEKFTPNAVGTWCWRADYSGDTTYPPAKDFNSTGECFTVIRLQPSFTTTQTWSVFDTVTIVVTGTNDDLAGDVLFELHNTTDCSTTPIFTSLKAGESSTTGTLIVSSGSHTFSGSPTAPGTLKWKVKYTSTNPAHHSVEGACGTENATLLYVNGGSENTPPK
jgi:hypothetical protein